MQRIIVTLTALVIAFLHVFPQKQYTILEQKGKFGLVDLGNEELIPVKYDYIGKINYPLVIIGKGWFELDEGKKLIDVSSKSRFGVFNLELNKEVAKCKYHWVSIDNKNTIVVFNGEFDTEDGIDKLFTSDNGFGLINKQEKKIAKCRYYYIDNREDNANILANFPYQKKEKFLQVIISKGKIEVEALIPSSDKKTESASLPVYQVIDNDGRIISNSRFTFIGPFANGLAVACELPFSECSLHDTVVEIYDSTGKFGYINKYGEVTIPFQFDKAQTFKNEKAFVSKDGREFYINKNGIEID